MTKSAPSAGPVAVRPDGAAASPIVLVACGRRLDAQITRHLRARGLHAVRASAVLGDDEADLSAIVTVIVALDPERTTSGLATLDAVRRRVPRAQRILIAPRSSHLVRPAILSGLAHRAWLAPVAGRLVGLLAAIRATRDTLPPRAADEPCFSERRTGS